MKDTPKLEELNNRMRSCDDPEDWSDYRKELRTELLDQLLLGNGTSTVSETFSNSDDGSYEMLWTQPSDTIRSFFELVVDDLMEECVDSSDRGEIVWDLPGDKITITTYIAQTTYVPNTTLITA